MTLIHFFSVTSFIRQFCFILSFILREFRIYSTKLFVSFVCCNYKNIFLNFSLKGKSIKPYLNLKSTIFENSEGIGYLYTCKLLHINNATVRNIFHTANSIAISRKRFGLFMLREIFFQNTR